MPEVDCKESLYSNCSWHSFTNLFYFFIFCCYFENSGISGNMSWKLSIEIWNLKFFLKLIIVPWADGLGAMAIPPVSVCHQESTKSQRPSPTKSWNQDQASWFKGSPTDPKVFKEDLSYFFTHSSPYLIGNWGYWKFDSNAFFLNFLMKVWLKYYLIT